LIKTGLYTLRSIDDTTFSLEVKSEVAAATTALHSQSTSNSNESLDSQPEVRNFKSKRKMFEFNYEIRFVNKDLKYEN
jgi:hypothetical protein